MANPLTSGPIAPYRNPPIEPQFYQPRQYYIQNIQIGSTTLITTTVDHDYVIGNLCRLIIPNGFGCVQLNMLTGLVINIPQEDQIVLNIDSSFANAFISNTNLSNQPQILPVGDINSGPINNMGISSTMTFIPGSYINISPN